MAVFGFSPPRVFVVRVFESFVLEEFKGVLKV